MAKCCVLYLFLLRIVIAIALSSQSPSSNASVSTPTATGINCAERSVDKRSNVRAIDCLNLFTFILATTDHTEIMAFELSPDQSPGSKLFSRTTGTCEFFVVFGSYSRKARPVREFHTLDEILAVGLGVIGLCLLDSRPDSTHWAGVGKINPMSKLRIGVAGLLPTESGLNGPEVNDTISLGAGTEQWLDDVLES